MENRLDCFKPLRNRIIVLIQLGILAFFISPLYKGSATVVIILFLIFSIMDVLMFCRDAVIKKGGKTAQISFFILAIVTLLSVSPELNDYLSYGSRGEAGILRIENLFQTINGTASFPIGIDSYNCPDLFLMIPAGLRLAGFSLIASYKFYVIAFAILTTVITYKAAIWCGLKRKSAVFLTICYLFCPYRLYVIYYLCDISEYTAFAFIPLIVAGIKCLISNETAEDKYRINKHLLIIGMTGLIASKPFYAGIVAVFALIMFAVFFYKIFRKRTICEIAISTCLILGMNGFYFISRSYCDFAGKIGLQIQEVMDEAKGLILRGRYFILWYFLIITVTILLQKKKYTVIAASAMMIMVSTHFLETALYQRTAIWGYDFVNIMSAPNVYLPKKVSLVRAFCVVSLASTIAFVMLIIVDCRKCFVKRDLNQ